MSSTCIAPNDSKMEAKKYMKEDSSQAGLKGAFDSLAITILDKVVLPWNNMSILGDEKIQQMRNAHAAELESLRKTALEVEGEAKEQSRCRLKWLRGLGGGVSQKVQINEFAGGRDALLSAATRHRANEQPFQPKHTTLVTLLEKTKGPSENLRNCEVKDKTSRRLWGTGSFPRVAWLR